MLHSIVRTETSFIEMEGSRYTKVVDLCRSGTGVNIFHARLRGHLKRRGAGLSACAVRRAFGQLRQLGIAQIIPWYRLQYPSAMSLKCTYNGPSLVTL
jgi:hypothetical protein